MSSFLPLSNGSSPRTSAFCLGHASTTDHLAHCIHTGPGGRRVGGGRRAEGDQRDRCPRVSRRRELQSLEIMGPLARRARRDSASWVTAARKGPTLSSDRRRRPSCLPTDEERPLPSALVQAEPHPPPSGSRASDTRTLRCTNPLPGVPASSLRNRRAIWTPRRTPDGSRGTRRGTPSSDE
jgi:hypothetical protein